MPERPPTVGTIAEYSEAPFERRTEWAREGDVVRIEGPEEDHHMVSHPEYVERVLFADDEEFVKYGGYETVFGNGLVAVYGDEWRAQRGALQPAFTPDRVRSYAETIGSVVEETVADLSDGETVNARRLTTELTVEVMLSTLFGGASAAGPITLAADRITEWFLEAATAGPVPDETQSKFEAGMERMTETIDGLIAERDPDPDSDDLISTLLAVGPGGDADYTDDRIRDEMLTLFFAAHETTALTLTYTLYLVADAPRVERRLRAELDAVLDGRPGPTHLPALDYTERVIDEALRLYSPAHSLFREAKTDVTVGGYRIPEGDVLYLPQWVIHRDERWWDEPTTFRPERFAGDDDRPAFTFFPFGAGPRRCIGERFARAEAKLAVAGLLDAFSFDRVTEEFGLRASLMAVPDRPIELTARAV